MLQPKYVNWPTFSPVIRDGNEETLDRLLQYYDVFRAPYLTAAGVHKFSATKFCTVAPNICRILLQFCPLTYLLTYLLHGAESFLRS